MATFSPSPAPRLRIQSDSAMDVDERASTITDRSLSRMGGDVLFAKTDEMSVLFYASLPLEVKQILRVSGKSTTMTIFNFESFMSI